MLDTFWLCLLESGVVYAHLDMQNPKDQQILASAFVDQSANDIRSHFHRIVSNWSYMEISELHRIAKFVYDQRGKLKEKDRDTKEA